MKKRWLLIFRREENLSFIIQSDTAERAKEYYFAHELEMVPKDAWTGKSTYEVTPYAEEDEDET